MVPLHTRIEPYEFNEAFGQSLAKLSTSTEGNGIPMELITRNDPNLEYVDMLGSGGYGSVYKVTQCLALTELQLKVVHNGKVTPRLRCRMLNNKVFCPKDYPSIRSS